MAGTTFTLGGISFAALDSTSGRKCLYCYTDAAEWVVHKFHPPGVNGNLLIFDGRHGGKITAVARYIGSVSGALGNYASDRNTLVGGTVTVNDGTTSFERCILIHSSPLSRPKAMGRGSNLVFFDAQFIFDWNG